jgi:hypothetical protein
VKSKAKNKKVMGMPLGSRGSQGGHYNVVKKKKKKEAITIEVVEAEVETVSHTEKT